MGVVIRAVSRGEVYLVQLGPTRGSEVRKTRPCVVVSPNELNHHMRTLIVAPMTTGGHAYPFRIPCRFQRRAGPIILDQLRTIDVDRLVRRLGVLAPETLEASLAVLREMFVS
jgi:mRNA interferase MazF